MQGAVRSCEGGILLDVDVTPSAQEDRFPDGYNEWRERIGARVRAPAEDGRANRALCEIVADAFGIDTGHVGVEHGHTASRKTLIVRGLSADEATTRLTEVSTG